MAERRMFAKTIIDSDAFLDMPLSAQALYFHLSMRADDEGFVNNPKKIQRSIGASDDDCKLLILKRFILTFESGVIVIKHWRIHNYIRSDRYKETLYKEERQSLTLNEDNAYTEKNKVGIPSDNQVVYQMDTQVRIGKDSIGKDRLGKDSIYMGQLEAPTTTKERKSCRFVAPTLEEVQVYCEERNNNVDAQRFIDYYTANGWKVGRNPMKDWKATVRTWERQDYERKPTKSNNQHSVLDDMQELYNKYKAEEENENI